MVTTKVTDVFHLMHFNGQCQSDCRLSRCTFSAENGRIFGWKGKKRKQQNTFSSKNETDWKESKSSLSASETKAKFGRSLS